MKNKKGISIVDAFQKILKESNRTEAKSKGHKPKKISIDKGSEFYNNSFKKWLKYNDIEICLINNEGKSFITERFIRTLKNKIFKHMTAIAKTSSSFDMLDDIVNKYNNAAHITIKMKVIDVKDNTYVDSIKLHSKKEVNNKDPKFKVGDHIRVSKYKNIFAKGYMPNWFEFDLPNWSVIKKVKSTVPWTCVINDLEGQEIIETLYEKELQKTNKKEFRIAKVIKRKGDKLYVKCKGFNNSVNSWIDKKDLVWF